MDNSAERLSRRVRTASPGSCGRGAAAFGRPGSAGARRTGAFAGTAGAAGTCTHSQPREETRIARPAGAVPATERGSRVVKTSPSEAERGAISTPVRARRIAAVGPR